MDPSAVEDEKPFRTNDAAGQHSVATLEMLISTSKVLPDQGGGLLASWPRIWESLCPTHAALQQKAQALQKRWVNTKEMCLQLASTQKLVALAHHKCPTQGSKQLNDRNDEEFDGSIENLIAGIQASQQLVERTVSG